MTPIAIQLIEKNIEPLESRLTRAVDQGQPSPIALIYDVACSLGQKVVAALSILDDEMKSKATEVIIGTEDGRIPYHIVIADRLFMGDLIADTLDGGVVDLDIADRLVKLIASPTAPNRFPILSIARKEESSLIECQIVGLLHTVD